MCEARSRVKFGQSFPRNTNIHTWVHYAEKFAHETMNMGRAMHKKLSIFGYAEQYS